MEDEHYIKYHINSIDDRMPFGKYKDALIKDIAFYNPTYIEWLCETVDIIEFSDEVIMALGKYCSMLFFSDQDGFLRESGSSATINMQLIKSGDLSCLICDKAVFETIKQKLIENNLPVPQHINHSNSRKIFNAKICIEKSKIKSDRINDRFCDEYDDDIEVTYDREELRSMYNDAYEIDSNEFDGWYEPID